MISLKKTTCIQMIAPKKGTFRERAIIHQCVKYQPDQFSTSGDIKHLYINSILVLMLTVHIIRNIGKKYSTNLFAN